MAQIHYLSELDKVDAYTKYRPIINDLSRSQLELLVLMIINGAELDYAVDTAMSLPKDG